MPKKDLKRVSTSGQRKSGEHQTVRKRIEKAEQYDTYRMQRGKCCQQKKRKQQTLKA